MIAYILAALLTGLIFLFVLVPIVGGSIVYQGWILYKLWGWFMVTTFHLPAITVAQAIGLDAVVAILILRIRPSTGKKDERENKYKLLDLLSVFLFPTGILLTGYVVHHWFM